MNLHKKLLMPRKRCNSSSLLGLGIFTFDSIFERSALSPSQVILRPNNRSVARKAHLL